MSEDTMHDTRDTQVRPGRTVDGGLGDVVSLVMPLRGGMWYAMVRDDGILGRADMMFGSREGAEAWVLDILEGVALERALNGDDLIDIDSFGGEAAVAA